MRFVIQNPSHRAFDESDMTLRIARAAKQVFLETGGSSFSMRLVAKQADISVGALQHFYPKKDQLMAAMLEFVTDEYEQAYDRVFRSLPFNGEARLLGAVEYLCSDIQRQETRAFFFALHALSCHNKLAAGIVTDMYSHHAQNIAAMVGAARPQLSEQRCKEVGLQVAALVDGMMIFTAPAAKHFDNRISLTETVKRAVIDLLDAPRAEVTRRSSPRRRQISAA